MKQTCFLMLFSFMWVMGIGQSVAPEVIATTGDHYTGTDVELSWTVGETVIETFDSGSNELTQGFHQTSLLVTSLTSIEELSEIKVFPNPTPGLLNIELEMEIENLHLNLFDVMGRAVLIDEMEGLTKTLDLSKLASGNYLLKLVSENLNASQTFKIQKIN